MYNNKKDFEIFKKNFIAWKHKFGLTDWKVYFVQEDLDGCFANITTNYIDKIATVRLTSKITKEDKLHYDPVRSAKHEALHLLLADLGGVARDRHVSLLAILEAEECTVNRLMEVLQCQSV